MECAVSTVCTMRHSHWMLVELCNWDHPLVVSRMRKMISMGCDSIYRTLQFEPLRPFCKICSWSCLTIMKLVSSWVPTYFSWSKTISSFEILWFHMLSIRSIFFPIFIMICCSNWRSLYLESLIFWAGFLIAGPSSLSQVSLIRIKKKSKGNFEFLFELLLFRFDCCSFYSPIYKMLWAHWGRSHKLNWLWRWHLSSDIDSFLWGRIFKFSSVNCLLLVYFYLFRRFINIKPFCLLLLLWLSWFYN